MIEIIKDNVGTWRDFKLRMTSKPNNAPQVKRSLIAPLRSQGILDFSRSPYEEVFFEERPLLYSFSRVIDRYAAREQLAHEIRQWAFQFTDGYLFDTSSSNYYYKQVSCVGCAVDLKTPLFTVNLEFMAYPRKIHQYAEGHGLWDVFDFDNDVWQDTAFRVPDIMDQLPLKMLAVGDEVNLGGWAARLDGETQGAAAFEEMYTIAERRATEVVLPYAVNQYRLAGLERWVNDYLIPQTHPDKTSVEVINTSSFPVIPQVFSRAYGSKQRSFNGISIETETGAMYTLKGRLQADGFASNDTFNSTFALLPGVNKLNIYGSMVDVEFVWHKEVV